MTRMILVTLGYGGSIAPPGPIGESPSVGAAGAAYLTFQPLERLALDVGGREGVASGDLRVVGAVQLGARYLASDLVSVRAGFVHHHETPWEAFREDPVMATFGSAEGIRHRSGLDGGLRLTWALPTDGPPVSTSLEASAMVFPDASGPVVYGVVQHLFTIGL